MPRRAAPLSALTVVAALAASVAVAGAADAATAHGRHALDLRATHDHRVVAPTTTKPGITHLRFLSPSTPGRSEIIVVEAKHPARSSTKQVAAALNGNSAQPLLKNYRLVAFVFPKGSVYARLTRGTYYLADAVDKIKAAKIRTMTVSGRRVDARPPASSDLVVSPHDNVRLPTTLPRSGWLHARSHSSTLTYFIPLPVAAKTTDAQLHSLVAHPTEKKLDAAVHYRETNLGFAPVTLLAPHSAFWGHYRDKPGRYVAVLRTFTGHGEKPLHHGEVQVVTLK